MSRLDRNECLYCGTKLVRIDGFPLCSHCEEKAKAKYFEARQNGGFKKAYKTIRPLQFKIGKKKLNLKQTKRALDAT